MPIVESGVVTPALFGDLLQKLTASIAVSLGKDALNALQHVENDYGEHLRQNFEKCTKIRTILNRDESGDLLSLYVNLNFKVGKKKVIDDYTLIEDLVRIKKAVISGTGGGGKSMFMRYLWLSMFNRSDRVPVFIELRRFNDMTSEQFSTFLFRSVISSKSKLTQDDFEVAIKDGCFALILDGFDEVDEDRRASVEAEILRIAREYPNNIIVVSGRPDDRFAGWQSFVTFNVQPLDKKQVTSLIGNVRYDEKIKKKFIQRIRKDLFDKHESFLSNPLLATMMLLTFDQFADIPEKVHLFYEQAFDTLFAKHDATKEAYKRKIFTSLPIDIFKKLFSYFALISYYEEKYEFSQSEVMGYISKAVKMLGENVDNQLFLADLCESVCILQRDGLVYNFSHRSFQEFFSAYCLMNFMPDKLRQICPNILGRVQDNVIPMCFDMGQEIIEAEYINPTLSDYLANLDGTNGIDMFEAYILLLDAVLLVRPPESHITLLVWSDSENYRFRRLMMKLYKKGTPTLQVNGKVSEMKSFIDKFLQPLPESGQFRAFLFSSRQVRKKPNWVGRIGFDIQGRISVEDAHGSLIGEAISDDVRILRSLQRSIQARTAKRAKNIDDIFGLK